ncbi:NHL repeat protein [uncultured archaeon]|nr:NHL repeat protein [uncultured archaeon]
MKRFCSAFLIAAVILPLLAPCVSAAVSDRFDYPVRYEFSGMTFAVIYNGTKTPEENWLESHLQGHAVFKSNTTSTSELQSYNAVFETRPLLGASKITELSGNVNLILIGQAVLDFNASLWGIDSMSQNNASENNTFVVASDSGPTRGYPENSTPTIGVNGVYEFSGDNFTAHLVDINTSAAILGSYSYGSGKTVLIGTNVSVYHTGRIMDKAVYWMADRTPYAPLNSWYCFNGASDKEGCSRIVVVIDNPSNVTHQENSTYYLPAITFGDTEVHRIELSELTTANLTPVRAVVVTQQNHLGAIRDWLTGNNKSIFYIYGAVQDLAYTPYEGASTGPLNITNTTRGLATVTRSLPQDMTWGYPVGAQIATQKDGLHYIATAPGFTALLTGEDGVFLTANDAGNYRIAAFGYDPYQSDLQKCTPDGYHGWIILHRGLDWLQNRLNLTAPAQKPIIVAAYSNDFLHQCPLGSSSPSEKALVDHMQSAYSGEVATVDLSLINITNYTGVNLVVVTTAYTMTSKIPLWTGANISMLYVHDGVNETSTPYYGGTVTAVEYVNYATVSNGEGGYPTYGYPVNVQVYTQYNGTQYYSSVSGYTTLARGADVLLSVKGTSPRVGVYGFDPNGANLSLCYGYHGWKLLDRTVDYLMYDLTIVGVTGKRIVVPFYSINANDTSTYTCATDQDYLIYQRISNKSYAQNNISRIDISVLNASDYTRTQMMAVGYPTAAKSMVSSWRNAGRGILFVRGAVYDAIGTVGAGSYSFDANNSGYANISLASSDKLTYGYPESGYIPIDFGSSPATFTILGTATLVTNEQGAGLVASGTGVGRVVAFGFNLTDTFGTCDAYHGWKLFDRSVEWILGILSVPRLNVQNLGLVVVKDSNSTCMSDEEKAIQARLNYTMNMSSRGILNTTVIEVSVLGSSSYANAEAIVIPDDAANATGNYHMSLIAGDTYDSAKVGVLMFKEGLAKAKIQSGAGNCDFSNVSGRFYGRITTSNVNNKDMVYPPYGYPYNAKIQIQGESDNACYWQNPSPPYVGFLKTDGSLYDMVGVVREQSGGNEKMVLLGFTPYKAWMAGTLESDADYHHAYKLFDRSIYWITGDSPKPTKTLDNTIVVYNSLSLTQGESTLVNWSRNYFGAKATSYIDVGDSLTADSCGAERMTFLKRGLISGIADRWNNLGRGLTFLGESVYDSKPSVAVITDVNYLGAEYGMDTPIYAQSISPHAITNYLTVGNSENVSNKGIGVYAFYVNTTIADQIANHTNWNGAGNMEILVAVRNQTGSAGAVSVLAFEPENASTIGQNWTKNAMLWVHPFDNVSPTYLGTAAVPSSYSNASAFSIIANFTDDRNWSVYNVWINYTVDYVTWFVRNLTQNVRPDVYGCSIDPNMNYWNASLGPYPAYNFIVYYAAAVDTAGNSASGPLKYYGYTDSTAPQVLDVRFTPYQPNSTSNISILWRTSEYSNGTVYYRQRGGGSWTTLNNNDIVINHTISVGSFSNGTYEYGVMSCDLSGNCRNDANNGNFYLFCVNPGCETRAPNITGHSPPNGTAYAPPVPNFYMNVTTNEWAWCRYSGGSDKAYANMTLDFNTSDGIAHNATITFYENSSTNTYYIRCRDMYSNTMNSSYVVYYEKDGTPPVIALLTPENQTNYTGGKIVFTYQPFDNVNISRCTLYTTRTGSWQPEYTQTNITVGATNNFTLTHVCSGTFRWNILCYDTVNNSAFAPHNLTLSVNSTLPIFTLGCQLESGCATHGGGGPAEFDWPLGLRPYNGRMYIVDYNNNRIKVYNTNGDYVTTFGTEDCGGSPANGAFCQPHAVSIVTNTTTARILAADNINNRVQHWTTLSTPTFVENVGINRPAGIASMQGKYFVASSSTDTITTYNFSTGVTINTFGSGIVDINCFGSPKPAGMYVSGTSLYLANRCDNTVEVFFTTGGAHLSTLGGYGTNQSHFIEPTDVYVDAQGLLYVADTENHRIQIFNATTLEYVYTLGTNFYGGGSDFSGLFKYPRGVAADESGNVWVSDTQNNRIQVFNLCYSDFTTPPENNTVTYHPTLRAGWNLISIPIAL